MDKEKKNQLLAIPNSQYENIISSSADHSILNKRSEHPIYKCRRSEIPSTDISSTYNGK